MYIESTLQTKALVFNVYRKYIINKEYCIQCIQKVHYKRQDDGKRVPRARTSPGHPGGCFLQEVVKH